MGTQETLLMICVGLHHSHFLNDDIGFPHELLGNGRDVGNATEVLGIPGEQITVPLLETECEADVWMKGFVPCSCKDISI